MTGKVTIDWGKYAGLLLWGLAVTCATYITVAFFTGVRGLHLAAVAAWGLLLAAAAITWTVSRVIAFATDRVLTMIDSLDPKQRVPLHAVHPRREQDG